MKRLITWSVMLLMLVALMTGLASAATQTHWFVLNQATSGTTANASFVDLDLGSFGSWSVACTGGTTLTATAATATLTGGFSGNKIWSFQYLDSASVWQDIIPAAPSGLVTGTGAAIATTVVASQNALPVVVNTQWLRIAYDASLTSDAAAVATGSASVTASIIPEPGSAMVLITGLLGVAATLKRRKG